MLRRAASQPLPSPPRRSRLVPWLLLALLCGLSTGLLVMAPPAAAAPVRGLRSRGSAAAPPACASRAPRAPPPSAARPGSRCQRSSKQHHEQRDEAQPERDGGETDGQPERPRPAALGRAERGE